MPNQRMYAEFDLNLPSCVKILSALLGEKTGMDFFTTPCGESTKCFIHHGVPYLVRGGVIIRVASPQNKV